MRHKCKRHLLGRASDQRKALLRTLATALFTHGEIKTTMPKAKALQEFAEPIITFAKKGDVAARRQASKHIYDQATGNNICLETGKVYGPDEAPEEGVEVIEETVLRRLFSKIAKDYADRKGGYTRILRLPPRRGDNAEMALIQLV